MPKPPEWPVARRIAAETEAAYATACSVVRFHVAKLMAEGMTEEQAHAHIAEWTAKDFELQAPRNQPKWTAADRLRRKRRRQKHARRAKRRAAKALAIARGEIPAPKQKQPQPQKKQKTEQKQKQKAATPPTPKVRRIVRPSETAKE